MSRTVFFRQSGWMLIATVLSGLCMFGVHPFSKLIPEAEYGVFGTMIAVLNCIGIPAIGLQMVFAQQTAAALTDTHLRQLTGTTRGVLLGTLLIWLTTVLLVGLFRRPILDHWHLANPAALWLTLLVGLGAVWSPIFGGILQGQQNFLWFGWASILNGAGRLAGVGLIVLLFQGYATGMVVGILLGTLVSLTIYVWQTRRVWLGPAAPFAWQPWLQQVVPLTLGLGAFQFMFSADPVFVKAWFDPADIGFYIAAGTLARSLVTFSGPVVWVMFPKIVRSMAISEKTDIMWLTLITITVLTSGGALVLSVVAPWLLQLVYKESYLAAVPLLRWFAWSMVPLTLANVLISNLMARSLFRVVPWLLAVAGCYAILLIFFHQSFLSVIRVLGISNLLFLGVSLWFTCQMGNQGLEGGFPDSAKGTGALRFR
jgi:O-antigen/teichoic acid export membrane protein